MYTAGDAPFSKESLNPFGGIIDVHEPLFDFLFQDAEVTENKGRVLTTERLAEAFEVYPDRIKRQLGRALVGEDIFDRGKLADVIKSLPKNRRWYITEEGLERLGFGDEEISRMLYVPRGEETAKGEAIIHDDSEISEPSREESIDLHVTQGLEGAMPSVVEEEPINHKDCIGIWDLVKETGLFPDDIRHEYREAMVSEIDGLFNPEIVLGIYKSLREDDETDYVFSNDFLLRLGVPKERICYIGDDGTEGEILDDVDFSYLGDEEDYREEEDDEIPDGFHAVEEDIEVTEDDIYSGDVSKLIDDTTGDRGHEEEEADESDIEGTGMGLTTLSLVSVDNGNLPAVYRGRLPDASTDEWDRVIKAIESQPTQVYDVNSLEGGCGIRFKELVEILGIRESISMYSGIYTFLSNFEEGGAYKFVLRLHEFDEIAPHKLERISSKTKEEIWNDLAKRLGCEGKTDLINRSRMGARIHSYRIKRGYDGSLEETFDRIPPRELMRMVERERIFGKGRILKGEHVLNMSQEALGSGKVSYKDIEFIIGEMLNQDVYLGDVSEIPGEISDRVINIFEQLRDAAEDECVGDILYLWRLGRGVIRHNGILYERDDYGQWIGEDRVAAGMDVNPFLEATYMLYKKTGRLLEPDGFEALREYVAIKKTSIGYQETKGLLS